MTTKKMFAIVFTLAAVMLTGVTANITLLYNLSTPKPTEQVQSIEVPKPVGFDKGKMYQLINGERNKAGLQPLATNALLEQSACLKAQDMVTKNYWSHVSPDGTQPWYYFELSGYRYDRAGENQLYGFKSSEEAVQGWMHSPKHKANLLGDYAESGLCILEHVTFQGQNDVTVVVQHFGTLQ